MQLQRQGYEKNKQKRGKDKKKYLNNSLIVIGRYLQELTRL